MAKIVIIEDDPQIRTLVETILSTAGYSVAGTSDPTTAVDLVRAEQPDLVFCDIAMPAMDGYAVLRALQSDPTTARFPVVFLTAHREFSERVRAFRFGVIDYLTKPFSRQILLAKVERVLEGLARRNESASAGIVDGPAQAVLDDVTRESRTGVLTVTDGSHSSQVVVRAGLIADSAPLPVPAAEARFQEIDPSTEDVVPGEPTELPGGSDVPPSFDALPDLVKDVLIVDDNAAFRRFLKAALTQQGFNVHEAPEGATALRLAVERRPWLIITDINMPGMDGFELCRRVRAQSLIRQTPLLFLSGWDDYKRRYLGLELGADDFVSKGTPIRELLIRIQLILRRYTDLGGGRGRPGQGMEGQLQVVGAPGILQMCHLGRLTGSLTAYDGPRRLAIGFRDGEIVSAESPDAANEPALYEFLGWDRGHFEFTPGDPGPGEQLGDTFDQLVLEGCRRLDEQRRVAGGVGA